jgi:hypothetical protein
VKETYSSSYTKISSLAALAYQIKIHLAFLFVSEGNMSCLLSTFASSCSRLFIFNTAANSQRHSAADAVMAAMKLPCRGAAAKYPSCIKRKPACHPEMF